MKSGLLLILLFLSSYTIGYAQSSRVLKFNVRPSNSGSIVQILWTMNPGSTCLNLIVERSANGVNYSEIYKYPSVCGSTDRAISYSWVDTKPLQFAKSFYRLKLDGAEFTLPIEVNLQANLSEKDIITFPNPSNGRFSIELKNEKNLSFNLELYNPKGILFYKKENCTGTFDSIDLGNIPRGVYLIRAFFTDRSSFESKLIIR
ncbi:MAG: T9SS type A sorting domain-containing protein [Flavobacteriales bacterium]|nr:T9SS type A sorting domain-containing protein [Flavobacteriales bacterium]